MNNDDIWTEARDDYLSTPIPAELAERVQAGIRQGARRHRIRPLFRALGSCAACFAVIFGLLNIFPTIASAAADIPILGGLFQVMTVRDYTSEEDGIHFDVTVPGVESGTDLAQQVNDAIQKVVDEHLAQSRQDWKDFCEAFLATGGTQEELDERSMDVTVDYDILSQTDTTVSFVVRLCESWVVAQEEHFYYNLDLSDDSYLTLQELLGDNWVSLCNSSVLSYIADSVDEDGFTYFFTPDEGGFTSVDEDTDFYINSDGGIVLVFPQYTIAVGAMGIVEIPVNG